MRQTRLGFDDAVVESIDETITGLLSRGVIDALYAHLKTFHSVSREEVPYRLDTLLTALEKLFGDRGTRTITKGVVRRLYLKLGLDFTDDPNRTLLEYVDEARMKLNISQ